MLTLSNGLVWLVLTRDLVLIFFFLCIQRRPRKNIKHNGLIFWIFFFWFFWIYETLWDIIVDWGLLRRKSKNAWLRDKLIIPHKIVYFVAIVRLKNRNRFYVILIFLFNLFKSCFSGPCIHICRIWTVCLEWLCLFSMPIKEESETKLKKKKKKEDDEY